MITLLAQSSAWDGCEEFISRDEAQAHVFSMMLAGRGHGAWGMGYLLRLTATSLGLGPPPRR